MYLVRGVLRGPGDSVPADQGGRRPAPGLLLTEPLRGLADLTALLLAAPALLTAPRGDGHGVLVFPGLGADYPELIEARVPELAAVETRDNGSLLRSHVRSVMPRVARNFRSFADKLLQLEGSADGEINGFAERVTWDPSGVTAVIGPWNAPLMLATWRIAPDLHGLGRRVRRSSGDEIITRARQGRSGRAASACAAIDPPSERPTTAKLS